ncbi:hypothetical protein V8D89_009017 [Ganoderma adspersum]
MSDHVTRKRPRAEEEEEALPPAKREPEEEDELRAAEDAQAGEGTQADGQGGNEQAFKRDTEFWFNDGTVILVARNVEFRVYEGLLAALSPVFKEIFGADGHAVRNERVGKVQDFPCPVVHVSDSPEDLRHLLRACFSQRLRRLYDERNPSYHEISAAIRLGEKYKIVELRSQSLEYLKYYFPSTLEGWTKLHTAIDIETPLPGWNEFEEVGVINLARLTGKLYLLPAAFIACICSESTEPERWGIGHGFTLEDGSQARLCPGDLTVCLNGKTSLRTASITAALGTFRPVVSPKCQAPIICKKKLRDLLLNLEEKNVVYLMCGNPFVGYEAFVEAGSLGVCTPCTTMVRERSLKERRDVWDRLPELLHIDVREWKKGPLLPPAPA